MIILYLRTVPVHNPVPIYPSQAIFIHARPVLNFLRGSINFSAKNLPVTVKHEDEPVPELTIVYYFDTATSNNILLL